MSMSFSGISFVMFTLKSAKKTGKTDNLHPLLREILVFIHPFAPFITEEIHSIIFKAPLIER